MRTVPTPMKEMTEIERAWLGAMVEAEGCIGLYNNGKRPKQYFRIAVANTDIEILSAFLRTTGVGHVGILARSPWATKDCFQWRIGSQQNVRELIDQCGRYSPKLQAKKGQV